MIWEVFRQSTEGGTFKYCRDVHAPDREMAKQFAVIQHGRRKPTNALWVAPQKQIASISPDEDPGESAAEGEATTWVVFTPNAQGYQTEAGTIEATDEASAKAAALKEFADPDDKELWVVEEQSLSEVNATQVAFGGTTDKAYRFAQTYNVDPAAEEVAASEGEQVEAERQRGEM
jgi:ring-1,2-phenylacetyl-CoA epoxidase subunit PaaB